jgi:hypothetical protein
VLVTARRFVDMGVVGVGEKELAHPATVDTTSRALQSPELLPPVGLSLLHGHGAPHGHGAVELDAAVGGTPGTGGAVDDGPDPAARPI